VKTLSRLTRYAIEPAYAIGARLYRAGINPEAAAIAAAVALSAVALTAQDRAFITSCQSAGGNAEVCALKVSGR
jgi:hypothetical protein